MSKFKPHLGRILNRYTRAVEDLAFKGSYQPDRWDDIEAEYTLAREKIIEALMKPINDMEVIKKVLLSSQVQALIGADEWDLTEEEEMILWEVIGALKDGRKRKT